MAIHKISSRQRKKLESAPSWPWANDISQGRTAWPIRGDTGPGMILSVARILTGNPSRTTNPVGRIGSQRWTPPNNVSLEDTLDLMRPSHADRYKYPSAISYQTGFISRSKPTRIRSSDNRIIRSTKLECHIHQSREHRIRATTGEADRFLIGFADWTIEEWTPVESVAISS